MTSVIFLKDRSEVSIKKRTWGLVSGGHRGSRLASAALKLRFLSSSLIARVIFPL